MDGEILGILFFGLLGLLLVVTPFISSERRQGKLNLLPIVGVFALLYILILSAFAYLT